MLERKIRTKLKEIFKVFTDRFHLPAVQYNQL